MQFPEPHICGTLRLVSAAAHVSTFPPFFELNSGGIFDFPAVSRHFPAACSGTNLGVSRHFPPLLGLVRCCRMHCHAPL
jgi:hypothetical protein